MFNWLRNLTRDRQIIVPEPQAIVDDEIPRPVDNILQGLDRISQFGAAHSNIFLSLRQMGVTVYEIADGDILVSPPTNIRHFSTSDWRQPLADLEECGLISYTIVGNTVRIEKTPLTMPVRQAWTARAALAHS